ncbi:THAP domain-containing protein 1-like [Pholidichthys leucotaenia]
MPRCSAYNCMNISEKGCGKTFHVFPRDAKRRRAWVIALRRKGFTPFDRAVLCSDHFTKDCFDRTGQNTRLRADAVPSVFNFPKHLQKNVKPRKSPAVRNSNKGQSTSSDLISSPPVAPVEVEEETQPLPPSTSHQADHTYPIFESPRSLKRKMERIQDELVSCQKRLKISEQKARRLTKKVDSLKSVVEELRKERLKSDNCMAKRKNSIEDVLRFLDGSLCEEFMEADEVEDEAWTPTAEHDEESSNSSNEDDRSIDRRIEEEEVGPIATQSTKQHGRGKVKSKEKRRKTHTAAEFDQSVDQMSTEEEGPTATQANLRTLQASVGSCLIST